MIEIFNDIANDIKGNPVYIMDVESGRNGYFCPTCKNQMVAVKSDKRRSYFRHDPNYVKYSKGECTYSSETYRHKLAKEFIQIHKKIKLPALYKYPPDSFSDKSPMLLRKSDWLYAAAVHIEMPVYEDEKGNICYGRGNSEYFIKPDAIFVNEKGEIILLIEFVISNDISEEKYALIRYYGVNTVKVFIPKTSPADIEKAILTTSNTHWVYNYEQENTRYWEPSFPPSKGVSFVDHGRERNPEWKWESCFKFRIANVIRGIERIMESDDFRERKRAIESSIHKLEKSTEELQRKFEEHTDGIENELHDKIGVLAIQEEREYRELEKRYLTKRRELEEEELGVEEFIRESRSGDAERAQLIDEKRETIKEGTGKASYDRRRIAHKRSRINRRRREIGDEYEQFCEKTLTKIGAEEREIERAIESISASIKQLPGEFTDRKNKLREDFERKGKAAEGRALESRRQLDRFVETRDAEGIQFKNKRRFSELFEARQFFDDLQDDKSEKRRIFKAYELFRSGAYKSWLKS